MPPSAPRCLWYRDHVECYNIRRSLGLRAGALPANTARPLPRASGRPVAPRHRCREDGVDGRRSLPGQQAERRRRRLPNREAMQGPDHESGRGHGRRGPARGCHPLRHQGMRVFLVMIDRRSPCGRPCDRRVTRNRLPCPRDVRARHRRSRLPRGRSGAAGGRRLAGRRGGLPAGARVPQRPLAHGPGDRHQLRAPQRRHPSADPATHLQPPRRVPVHHSGNGVHGPPAGGAATSCSWSRRGSSPPSRRR
jgi:hypothetical protein